MSRLRAQLLPDGQRLHLQDGPIDLIVRAWGAPGTVSTAYMAAHDRARTILDELCAELPELRRATRPGDEPLCGTVARRMQRAVAPFAAGLFITPMAAVAGAVADDVLEAMCSAVPLARAFVNNGGDIAVHLGDGEVLTAGLVDRPDRPGLFAGVHLTAEGAARGVATSGWRGRSHSLGIADAVTVLAATASEADAAATVIANAVDLPGHPGVHRVPCADIDPDSDLGALPVTCAVDPLAPGEIRRALAGGLRRANTLAAVHLIQAAALHLQGSTVATQTAAPGGGPDGERLSTGAQKWSSDSISVQFG